MVQPSHPYSHVLALPHEQEPTFDTTAILPYHPQPPPDPLHFTDVYMDDFMIVAQPPHHIPMLDNLLHHLHSVFTSDTSSLHRSVIRESKIRKGDATFQTTKTLLGWEVDTAKMELCLPAHRQQCLYDILDHTLAKPCSTRKQWQQLLGELRSMTLAIHSTRYLFSILQHALTQRARRFRINKLTRQALQDWKDIVNQLHTCPVPITMVVPHAPHYWAAMDASKEGIGGFWLPSNITPEAQPCAWRHKFHPNIPANLISFTNPVGTLCNSDLELAAVVVGNATQQHYIPKPTYTCTYIATDNSATQAWIHKGSTTTAGPPAFLLRQLALDCCYNSCTVIPIFTPGHTNTIADFLSRSFALSDDDLVQQLQQRWPIQPPWRLVTPPGNITSSMNWALSKQLPPKPSQ